MSARFDSGGFQTGLVSPRVGDFFGASDVLGRQYWDSQGNNMETRLGRDQERMWDAQSAIYREGQRGGTNAEINARNWALDAGNSIGQNFYAAQRMNYNPTNMSNMNSSYQRQMGIMGSQRDATSQRAQQMFNMGQNSASADYGQMAGDRLSLLREQAAPQEERASNSMAQKLFSMGQLGTEGGARNVEAFGTGLARADFDRQINANDFAQQQQNLDRQYGMGMMNAGNAQSNQAYNMSSGMLGNAANMFSTRQQSDTSNMNRAQQRMNTAQNYFQFGQDTRAVQEARMGAAQTGMMGLAGDQRDNMMAINQIRNGAGYSGGNSSAGSVNPWAAGAAAVGGALATEYIPKLFDRWGATEEKE